MENKKLQETKTPTDRNFVRAGDVILPADIIQQIRVSGESIYVKVVGQDEEISCGSLGKPRLKYQWPKDGEKPAQKKMREKHNKRYQEEQEILKVKTLSLLLKSVNARKGK